MGTGFREDIKIVITGSTDEDYENRTRQSNVFIARLNALCAEFGLSWEREDADG